MKMTVGGVLHNLKDWSFEVNGVENRYSMPKSEFEAIESVLERAIPKKRNNCGGMPFCPVCGNDVLTVWKACPFCMQRLGD